MKVPFCDFYVPSKDAVWSYLEESKDHRRLSNFGPLYRKFCSKLEDFLGLSEDRCIVVCSSGHVALMTAYALADPTRVIIPDYTFESTRVAATLQGIKVKIVDVDLKTTCLELDQLNQQEFYHLANGNALCAVTALSNIPDLSKLQKFCYETKRAFIIDAASAFGTTGIWNFDKSYACVSLHSTKSFHIGECGLLILNKKEKHKAEVFINFGLDPSTRQRVLDKGINGKVSEYTCAVGLAALHHVKPRIVARLTNARYYRSKLGDLSSMESWRGEDRTVRQFYPVFLPSIASRDRVKQKLLDNEIEVHSYYEPLIGLSNARSLFDRNLCLPVHVDVADHLDKIVKLIRENV